MATQLLSDHEIESNADQQILQQTLVENPARSGLERFLDSFFHPSNIKWMLLVGAAIVLGSSLMLVTKQWSNWPAAIKYLAMLGYTAAIYVFAEMSDKRLGLKSTGNVMRALSILLMPVLMLGLGWVATQPSTTGLPIYFEVAVLFLPATALFGFASRNVFHHFLRGHQLTFQASYLLLAIAGVLPNLTEPWTGLAFIAASWAIMTVGVIKVNRHTFWLTEEHRMPRIFGFFPILLLGAQFLLLCGTKVLFTVPPQWLGLATVMLATTVLATTRSIATVFRERTGDLVRPLPWSIALPLFVGVLLAFVGVSISFWGFHFVGTTTYAVVPTAIVASVLLFVVAYDTRHWAFTALALVLVTIAYQCAPTLIVEWINLLKAGAASAVREEKLPIAFYGITYLPLLALLTVASRTLARVRRTDISTPIQMYVTGVTTLLWCSSLFNEKAVFVVAAINVVSFAAYAIAFQDRRYMLGSLGAIILCAGSWVPFVNAMVGASLSINCVILSLLVVGIAFYSSRLVDSVIEAIPLPESCHGLPFFDHSNRPIAVANLLGLFMVGVLACLRLACLTMTSANIADASSLSIDVLLLAALSLVTFRTQHYLVAFATTLLPAMSAVSYANQLGWSWAEIADAAAMIAASVSIAGLVLIQWSTTEITNLFELRRSFGLDLQNLFVLSCEAPPVQWKQRLVRWFRCHIIAISDTGTFATVALGLILYVPHILQVNVFWSDSGATQMAQTVAMGWLAASLLLLRSRWAASGLAVLAPVYTAAVLVANWPNMLSQVWAPVIWVCIASLLCMIFHFTARKQFGIACVICRIWLSAIALVGFVYLSVPIRIAVAISVATLLIAKGGITIRGEKMFLAILCNVHALLLIATLAGAEGWVIQNYSLTEMMTIGAALFPAIALSILVSDMAFRKISFMGAEWWSTNLRLLATILFVLLCMGPLVSCLGQSLVLLGILIVIASEFLAAIRSQRLTHAWACLATIGLIGVWGWDQGWIEFGTGLSQLALVLVAAVSLWLSKVVQDHARYGCFTNPLTMIGLIVPGLVAALAVIHEVSAALPIHRLIATPSWQSSNYVALLFAAAIYFFHGINSEKRRYVVLSAVILNIGLTLIWLTNGITDPQFYCVPIGLSILWIVELLKKELPSKSHDPIRYVGALIILVSPVFGILGSCWLHLFSLMVLCVLVILLAIGLRIRVLMYTGTAFLLADICGMIIQSTNDNPTLLSVAGVGLGGAVIALAAICENHRENVLAKIRMISAELATWN